MELFAKIRAVSRYGRAEILDYFPEAPGLKPNDQVIGASHDNHGAHGLTMSPPLGPEIKHVVQVNVGKGR
jgi:hypothetical protein